MSPQITFKSNPSPAAAPGEALTALAGKPVPPVQTLAEAIRTEYLPTHGNAPDRLPPPPHGVSDLGAAAALRTAFASKGWNAKIAVVQGDDVLTLMGVAKATPGEFAHLFDGSDVATVRDRLVFANAYLGARPIVAFARVFLPMSLPGLYAGGLIVFVAGLGFYVVPQLLGDNAGGRFLSQYTADYMAQAEWGYGSAIGTILLLVTLTTLATAARVLKVGEILRQSFGGAR